MSHRAAALVCALVAIVPTAAIGQDTGERRPTRISKQDLTRMLVGGTYERDEIAGMIQRACLSFVPTATERELFRGLGAERSILSAIDGCLAPPTPLRGQPSEVPAQPSRLAPAMFASPAVTFDSVVRSEDRAPEAVGERPEPPGEEPANPPEEAEESSPPGPPAEEPVAGEQVSDAAPAGEQQVSNPPPLIEPGIEGEAPASIPISEAPADTVAPADVTDSRTDSLPAPANPVGPSDEVSRLRQLVAGASARGDVETALHTLRDIISLAPEDALAWFQLGAALASAGDREGARKAFIHAARLDRAKRRTRPPD
jgi:hypothetical protein